LSLNVSQGVEKFTTTESQLWQDFRILNWTFKEVSALLKSVLESMQSVFNSISSVQRLPIIENLSDQCNNVNGIVFGSYFPGC
jgi:hypothetical protein